MDEYLNKGIKEIIEEFPEVESVLNDYDIGCGPCSVGICQLKDVVAIHRLSSAQEQQLMARIARAVHPDQDIQIPRIDKKTETQPQQLKYSVKNLDVESEKGRRLILDGIDMIRSYADKFHHAKEEDILFKYFDESADILKVMHADHTHARGLVKEMLVALEEKDQKTIAKNLMTYRELLSEHSRLAYEPINMKTLLIG